MHRLYYFLSTIFVLLMPLQSVTAGSVTDNWIICDSCTTPSQFESAAITWYGTKTTHTQVIVGNPSTGEVRTMWLSRTDGRDPLSMAERATIGQQKVVFTQPADTTITSAQVQAASGGGSNVMVEEGIQDPDIEPAFQSLVIGTKNHLLFNVSSSQINQFPSLVGSSYPEICLLAWEKETSANPSWANFMGVARTAMRSAVKSYFGRGVLVSIVFGNGDTATFELIPGAPSACGYIADSAKDKMGSPLPEPATPVGGGGGGGGVVTGGSGPTPRSYSIGGSTWLICSFSGGVLIGCYVQPVSG